MNGDEHGCEGKGHRDTELGLQVEYGRFKLMEYLLSDDQTLHAEAPYGK